MGFDLSSGVSAAAVFAQGLLSFLSPCVLPLLPVYISYLAGGALERDEQGRISYPRRKILFNTLFFVLGISAAFFVLGLGVTALGRFFTGNRAWFARISGILMIVFGMYQMGWFGKSEAWGKVRRLSLPWDGRPMGPLAALLLGFSFSFAWTPCVGPILAGVLLMAGTAQSAIKGFAYIGIYSLGFVLPFLAVGMFTGKLLDFFKKNQKGMALTVKLGAILLMLMGVMTLTGFMNGITGYLSTFGQPFGQTAGTEATSQEETGEQSGESPVQSGEGAEGNGAAQGGEAAAGAETAAGGTAATQEAEEELDMPLAPDFVLTDQYGQEHTLSDYQGKVVFLNFWATWCPPCRQEMPNIQALYEKHGGNIQDLVVLGVASPNAGREQDAEAVAAFLEEQGYTFPVVMDEGGQWAGVYGISAYPTTFMIDREGRVFGYVQGAITADMMDSIVEQTMSGQRRQ